MEHSLQLNVNTSNSPFGLFCGAAQNEALAAGLFWEWAVRAV
jgi:hypothetical protein